MKQNIKDRKPSDLRIFLKRLSTQECKIGLCIRFSFDSLLSLSQCWVLTV